MSGSLFNKVAGGAWNFIKTEALTQVFSCEFCKIFKNTLLYRIPLVAVCKRRKPLHLLNDYVITYVNFA